MRAPIAALLWLAAPAAAGQSVVTSPAPDAVSVTLYRGSGDELELDDLRGYAVITETRRVTLPAGPSQIRFEGVAGSMEPASAIVRGLPGGLVDKNQDAQLLSPGALVAAALGRSVRIRRTNPVTGLASETEAVLRSGPGGVILESRAGVEALRCSGLPETLIFDEVPAGLSDKAVFAVRTTSPAAGEATVTLSYIASGFDWRANYVAAVAADGRTLDLFAWLTLANGNNESFRNAQTQAVAGTVNREEADEMPVDWVPAEIDLRCWPLGRTSDPADVPPPPVYAEEGAYAEDGGEEVVVTGSRVRRQEVMAPVAVVTATQEELGDLKLYRIPEPVTVAANGQKQVALLSRAGVRFERLHGVALDARDGGDPRPASILLRMRNRKGDGLGLPLPSGTASVFEVVGARPMLAGEAEVEDVPVGQDLELLVGESPEVQVRQQRLPARSKAEEDRNEIRRYRVDVTNAGHSPITLEATLALYGDWRLIEPSAKLGTKNGRLLWRARVPARGRSSLTYTLVPLPVENEPDED